MTDKFDRLITVLDQELKLTGTEIAEILWLGMQRQPHSSRERKITPSGKEAPTSVTKEETDVPKSELGAEETTKTEDKKTISKTPSYKKPTTRPKHKDSEDTPHAKVYPKTISISLNKASSPIKVPGASSLRNPLNIARALRPLIRYISAGKAVLLDEEATAELIAELDGICIPVLKAPLELQFDLALVIDESDSMIFWRETTQELQQLFKHYGIFRNLQTWGMVTDEKGNVRLRQGIGKKIHSRYRYSPQKVIDPSGRRLILVVSDCVSEIWRNGKAFSLLESWGKHNIAAIVQILPERMWLRTSLSLGAMVQLDCFKPTVSNRNLFVKEILLWNDVDLKTGIKVPVFSLEPDLVETWSEMVVKKGDIGAGGFVFSASSKQEQMQLIEDVDKDKLTSEERVYNFQMSSSEIAQNLANLLAAAPVINLPIVRLIQKNLLCQSQQVHVAEVFLGGILKPQTLITPDTNTDEVQYHFIDEKIRDILLKESPRIDSKEIITIISEDFAKRLKKSPKEFYALLKKPDELEDELEKLPQEKKIKHFDVKHFAKINTKVLKRLGGAYAHFAQEIEDAWQERDKEIQNLEPERKSPFIRSKTTVARRILILPANTKTSREQFHEQVWEIEDALKRAQHRDQFKLLSKWTVRPRDIQRAMLDNKPQIVHFLGHGGNSHGEGLESHGERKLVPLPEEITESEGLVFEDNSGQARLVSGEALAGLFGLFADTLECVVINNCYAKEQAEEIAKFIPYVIGTEQAISNKAALEFAVGFYDALGANRPIQFAYDVGCQAIQMAGFSKDLNPIMVTEKKPTPVLDFNEAHFQDVLRAITRGQIVPFLGPAINFCDRQEALNPRDWNPEGSYPPTRSELAVYLEKEMGISGETLTNFQCPLCSEEEYPPQGCPIINTGDIRLRFQYVSQLCELRLGEGYLIEAMARILTHPYDPNKLHQFFAKLPRTLREKGYETPILIVTANYDDTLERAFKNEKQPFDLVSYVDSEKRFLHQKFRKDDREEIVYQDGKLIIEPNDYRGIDFDTHPVILKLYGSVNSADYQEKNFVITEDDFIDYLAQRPIEQMLPKNILRILRRNHIWFLGYGLSNWDERVALHRIWANEQKHSRPWWAIQERPNELDKSLWQKNNVTLITMSLENYLAKLNQLVEQLLPK